MRRFTPLLAAAALGAAVLPATSDAAVRTGHASSPIAAADFNRDGKLDLAVGGGTSLRIRLGDGAGGFRSPARGALPVVGEIGDIAATDLNGDRRLDLAAVTTRKRALVFTGDGRGGFRPAAGSPVRLPHDAWTILPGRVDRNATTDLMLTGEGASLIVLLGDGRGGLRVSRASRRNSCPYCYNAAATDADGDGFTDLLAPLSHGGGGLVTLLGGARDGAMPRSSRTKGVTGRYPAQLAVADLDGDRRLDAAVAIPSQRRLNIVLGDGRGGFPRGRFSPTISARPGRVIAGDLNRDGRADLVAQGGDDAPLDVLLGDGKGGFEHVVADEDQAMTMAPADVNRDGRTDVVGLRRSGVLVIRLAGAGGALAAPAVLR